MGTYSFESHPYILKYGCLVVNMTSHYQGRRASLKLLHRDLVSHASLPRRRDFPPDIIRLLEILARIELRRQERLRAMRTNEKL
jgi:hypothetical protein